MAKKVSARRVVWTSFFVDTLDVLLNVAIAMVTGSVVMLAEALQGLADLTTATLLVIGLKRSSRRADLLHSFGYGREIYFWTLMSGVIMMAVTSSLSIHYGWGRIIQPAVIEHLGLAFSVLVLGFATNVYACSLSYHRLVEQYPRHGIWHAFFNSSRIETKATFILDLMGSASALFGIISLTIYVFTGNSQFDGVGAILIGVTIAVLALLLINGVKDFMIGRSVSPQIADEIRKAVLLTKEVDRVLDLRTMYIGTDKLLVNAEVHVKPSLKTRDLEKLIDEIKANVRHEIPSIHHLQIELETLN